MSVPHEILDGLDRLEPMPVTVQRLMTALGDEDVSFGDVVEIIEHDEAVASNVLRRANSSAFAGTKRFDSLRGAAIRLGMNQLAEIVVGDQLRALSVDAPMYDLDEREMWRHGAGASIAAKLIAAQAQAEVSGLAPIAALVHDIGKLLLVRYTDVDVRRLLERCDTDGLSFVQAEREELGCDHAQVGAMMARSWSFPEEIADAIARHHEYPLQSPTAMLDTVTVANFVCKTIGVGLGAAGLNLDVDEGALERLGLGYEQFCTICAETSILLDELE